VQLSIFIDVCDSIMERLKVEHMLLQKFLVDGIECAILQDLSHREKPYVLSGGGNGVQLH
jgi:hypothetical protein